MGGRSAGRAVAAAAAGLAGLALAGCGTARPTGTSARSSSSAAAPAPPASSATTPHAGSAPQALTVTPRTGTPHSILAFGFLAGTASGRHGSMSYSYTLGVHGPSGVRCDGALATALTVLSGSNEVHLGPRAGGWCVGRYSARVQEMSRPVCAAGQMCPQFIRVVAIFGPVTFRIAG